MRSLRVAQQQSEVDNQSTVSSYLISISQLKTLLKFRNNEKVWKRWAQSILWVENAMALGQWTTMEPTAKGPVVGHADMLHNPFLNQSIDCLSRVLRKRFSTPLM